MNTVWEVDQGVTILDKLAVINSVIFVANAVDNDDDGGSVSNGHK